MFTLRMATALTLPASRLADAQALISRWTKRAEKLGLAAPTLTVVRSFTRYWLVTPSGNIIGEASETCPVVPADKPRWSVDSLDLVEVEVVGERPKLAGWWFTAVIEHRDGGNILRTVPGTSTDLPHVYRTSAPTCDHCRLQRDRNETFVVSRPYADGSLNYMQVGRSCLRDFVGGVDPAAFLDAYQFARAIEELAAWDVDGDGGFGGAARCVPLERFMAVVAADVRLRGYVSASKARESIRPITPTGMAAYMGLTDRDEDIRASWTEIVTDADRRTAAAALAWVRSPEAGDSDYIHNCRVYAGCDHVDQRAANTLASVVPSYLRAAGIQAERTEKLNEHLPGVAAGDKITEQVATLVGEHCYDTDYGLRWILRFEDPSGRCIIWRTGDSTGLDRGTQVLISGTVKALGEYGGTQQTELSRCKVVVHVAANPLEIGTACEAVAPKRKAGRCDTKANQRAHRLTPPWERGESCEAPVETCTTVDGGNTSQHDPFAAWAAA